MSHIDQAARHIGPVAAADATGRTGVMRIAVTGAAQSFALPAADSANSGRQRSAVGARFIRIACVGVNVQWAFGIGAAPTIALNEISVSGTGDVNAGATMFNSVPEQPIIPSGATHVGFIGDAAAGFLEWYVSDKPVP
jgi:hypothetical protein